MKKISTFVEERGYTYSKLAELHDAGILTDAEFEAKKRDLLDRM